MPKPETYRKRRSANLAQEGTTAENREPLGWGYVVATFVLFASVGGLALATQSDSLYWSVIAVGVAFPFVAILYKVVRAAVRKSR